MKDLSPIVVFVYNRVDLAQKTIKALQQNDLAKESLLYVFSDAAKGAENIEDVEQVRNYIRKIDGFKNVEIFEAISNNGLGKSIINGVTKILDKHPSVIVLEDDLISSPDFLDYTNNALEKYKNNDRIYSTSGYFPPISIGNRNMNEVCFVPRISSLGWGIWKDRWLRNDWSIGSYKDFIKSREMKIRFSRAGKDMLQMLINQVEGKSTAWAIKCDYNRYYNNDMLTVYPCISKIQHIGNDGRGTNTPKSDKLNVVLSDGSVKTHFDAVVEEDIDITANFKSFYTPSLKSELVILLRRLGLYK